MFVLKIKLVTFKIGENVYTFKDVHSKLKVISSKYTKNLIIFNGIGKAKK